jgi:ATP-dependent Lon protease
LSYTDVGLIQTVLFFYPILISTEITMHDNKSETMRNFPLPPRDLMIFPEMVVPNHIGRDKSVSALEKAVLNRYELFVATQKDPSILKPEREDLYDVGTVISVIQILRLPEDGCHVVFEGKYRAKIKHFQSENDCYFADIEKCADIVESGVEIEALIRSVKEKLEQYVNLNKRIPKEVLNRISPVTDLSRLADLIVPILTMQIPEQYEILSAVNVNVRLQLLMEKMQKHGRG